MVYGRDIALELLVPYEMREIYRMYGDGDTREEIHALARYSNFRRFHTGARIVAR